MTQSWYFHRAYQSMDQDQYCHRTYQIARWMTPKTLILITRNQAMVQMMGMKKPTCNSIIADLKKLQVKMLELAQKFQDQLPAFYDLKSRVDGLKDEEMDDYHASRREVEATLEDIKAEFTYLNAKYSEGWATLTAKAVWTTIFS
ncbi:hypothetical protein BASA60_003822 [Batrachochytrium salamandrivorans]|nr:hypothetical protein BASA60_003822 [Batrachochytrium salamandrivorans]